MIAGGAPFIGKETTVRIGIIGSGHIGANAGRQFARVGHEVLFSFSREAAKPARLAAEAGGGARAGTPREAVAFGDLVLLAVPWPAIDDALAAAGPLAGKIVVDTTNQFGRDGFVALPGGLSAAEANARRLPGARQVKAFNTLTAGFQAAAAGRAGEARAALFLAGEDASAKQVVAGLIEDIGFFPADVGGWAEVSIMDAPRRAGAVYGEEYRPAAAQQIAVTVRTDPVAVARLADELKVAD